MNLLHIDAARLLIAFGHFLWIGALDGILAALVCYGIRRHAALRYNLLLALFVCMAAAVPLTYAWRGAEKDIELLPALEATIATPIEDAAPEIAIAEPLDAAEEAFAQMDVKPAVVTAAPQPFEWRDYAPYAVMAYFAAAFLMLLRLAAALYGGARLRRDAEPVEDENVLAAIRRSAVFLRLRVSPVVAYSLRVAGPTVVGVVRPMVLLPASLMTGLSADQVQCLLLHELAHIRRYDHVVNIIQRVIESLLFFHPAVWYVSHRIRVERELCCDDLAVAFGGGRRSYAELLVAVASRAKAAQPALAPEMQAMLKRRGQLRHRVERLLGTPDPPVRLRHGAAFLMVVLLGCGFALYAQVAPPAPPELPASTNLPQPAEQAIPDPPVPPVPPVPPGTPVAPAPDQPGDMPEVHDSPPTPEPAAIPKIELDNVPPEWRELVEQTRDEDWWLRKVAMVQLAERGGSLGATSGLRPDFTGILIQGLKDPNPQVQAAAAEGLGKLREPQSVKHLVAALKGSPVVVDAASAALKQFPQEQVLPLLRLAIQEGAMYLGAVRALAELGTPEAAEIVFSAKPQPLEARQTTNGVGFAPNPESPQFIEAISRFNPDLIAGPLRQALEKLDPDSQVTLLRMLGTSRDISGDAEARIVNFIAAPSLSEAVASALTSPRANVRAQVVDTLFVWAHALREYQQPVPEQITQALAQSLRDQNYYVGRQAVYHLENLQWQPQDKEQETWYRVMQALANDSRNYQEVVAIGPAAVEPLLHVLQASKEEPQTGGPRPPQVPGRGAMEKAILALGELKDPRAVEPLVAVVKSDDERDAEAAATALGKIGDPAAIPALVDATQRAALRGNAIGALAVIKDPSVVEPLIRLLADENTRWESVYALGELRDPRAVPALADLLLKIQNDPSVEPALDSYNQTLLEALGKIGSKDGVGAIAAIVPSADGNTKQNAANALGNIGGEEAIAVLADMTKSEDIGIVITAADNLAKTNNPAAVGPLVKLMESTLDDRRQAGLSALVEMDVPQAQQALVDHADLSYHAVMQLAQQGHTRLIPVLEGYLPKAESLNTTQDNIQEVLARLKERKALEAANPQKDGPHFPLSARPAPARPQRPVPLRPPARQVNPAPPAPEPPPATPDTSPDTPDQAPAPTPPAEN